jgi:hypothetical protein
MALRNTVDANGPFRLKRDPRTHWGMGSSHMPLATEALEETLSKFGKQYNCAKRGGLRSLANKLFPETELVVKPNNIRLQVHREPSCNQKHFGFCKGRDAIIKDVYDKVLTCLKHHQRAAQAGALVLRFRPVVKGTGATIAEYNAFTHDKYMSFSWFRGNPKFAAFHMQMQRFGVNGDPANPNPFPHDLEDRYRRLPAIPSDETVETMLTSNEMWNVYQYAKEIAFEAGNLPDAQTYALETLAHEVQSRLAHVSVTAVAEALTPNVLDASKTKSKEGDDSEGDKDKDKATAKGKAKAKDKDKREQRARVFAIMKGENGHPRSRLVPYTATGMHAAHASL